MRSDLGAKQDGNHATDARLRIEGAQGSEAHACGKADDLAHASHARVVPRGRNTMKRYGFQGGSMSCPSPRAANSVRCVRVADLLAEEVSDFHDFVRSQLERNPTQAGVSQPDAEAAVDAGSDAV